MGWHLVSDSEARTVGGGEMRDRKGRGVGDSSRVKLKMLEAFLIVKSFVL